MSIDSQWRVILNPTLDHVLSSNTNQQAWLCRRRQFIAGSAVQVPQYFCSYLYTFLLSLDPTMIATPMLLSSRSSSSFILRTGFVATISTLAFQSLWQPTQQQQQEQQQQHPIIIAAEAFPLIPSSNTSCRAANNQQHRFFMSSSSSSSAAAQVSAGVVGIDYPELVVR